MREPDTDGPTAPGRELCDSCATCINHCVLYVNGVSAVASNSVRPCDRATVQGRLLPPLVGEYV
jgi:hypothetical protein